MTRRNIEDVSSNGSPAVEGEGGLMSPPPPQASPADRSPYRESPVSPTMLATMTPVNVLELKKEMDEKRAIGNSPVYTQVKTEVLYEKDDEVYSHEVGESKETPIDLIYDDGSKTVIYTTTPGQKGFEMYSSNNASDITVNNVSAHQIQGQHISDVLIDGSNSGGLGDSSGNPTGTVSVVLQGNSQGLLQYPHQSQVPATTVLLVSELVDDMGLPVVGLRKRKENLETNGGTHSRSGAGLPVAVPRVMAELPEGGSAPPDDQQTWRAYYEHPLTAATTAMLNIGAGGTDDQTATMGLICEYYKVPSLLSGDSKDKLAELWPANTSQAGGILTSQLKAANGLVSGAGLELSTPPLSSASGSNGGGGGQLCSQDIQGLFVNQHVGYASTVTSSGGGGNLQIVKREPEDLSHHRKSSSVSPGLDGGSIIVSKPRHKVVLVSSATTEPGSLVVDVNSIKDESRLNSPQHGSRSVNGTPTSTHSSLLADGSNNGPVEFVSSDGIKQAMYGTQIFTSISGGHGESSSPSPGPYGDNGVSYSTHGTSATYSSRTVPSATLSADPYYREYFTTVTSAAGTSEPIYSTQLRQGQISTYGEEASGSSSTNSFVERYVRQSSAYHSKGVIAAATAAGLTVDLPSPDSGIGTDAITPRDQNTIQQSFDYPELCQTNSSSLLDPLSLSQRCVVTTAQSPVSQQSSRSRPWHDFGRQNDADKIQIPKIFSPYGFKYFLETPISTSQRREDDRITYINKGQFYGITLEYIPEPDKQLKLQTVKSIVMLMFREEKSPEDEIKAWQFWHGRQHSIKQRILDADTKNSVGLVSGIEEVAHNAIAVYWNPLESPAKINVAVQCLSTDFSSQKGVKGLPLHLQIDTYEDPREPTVSHRGYCQIKVFCDKGAERKTRDEERRAAKRKMTATGRKKLDELYHPVCDRSEFYSMSDLTKPPVLFTPAEDIDKLTSMELQGFYAHDTDSSLSGPTDHIKSGSPFLLHTATKPPSTPTLKFHNHFPPDSDKKDSLLDGSLNTDGNLFSPPPKRAKILSSGPSSTGPPPLNERVMLYVRQDSEDIYTPLHVVPPSTQGLLNADYSQN
ncbi:protein grainyhead isoform X2 [Agrilus planipennis]|uniref:Protein grainyhead isoform X2 n=1 Tax=Agrilus planipennis TaxID=224129 RepID=A0A7F5REB5_AGRPL|nr:protein grainyhead isoform X2 [Agrilus planipennis]